MKAHGWISAPRRIPVRDQEVSWVQAYERRMRRFNLEVIVFALSALTILIAWFFSDRAGGVKAALNVPDGRKKGFHGVP